MLFELRAALAVTLIVAGTIFANAQTVPDNRAEITYSSSGPRRRW